MSENSTQTVKIRPILSSDEFVVEVGTVQQVLDRLSHAWPDQFSAATVKRAYLLDRQSIGPKLSIAVCPRRQLAASHTYDIVVPFCPPLLTVIDAGKAGKIKVYDFARRDICDWSDVMDTPFAEFENLNTDPESPHRVFTASRMCADIPGFPTIGYYLLEEQIRPWLSNLDLNRCLSSQSRAISVFELTELLFDDLGFDRNVEFADHNLLTLRMVIRALRDMHTTEIDDDTCLTGGEWCAYLREWMKVL